MDTNIKAHLVETKNAVAVQRALVQGLLTRYETFFRNGIATANMSCENLSISYLDTLKQFRQLDLDFNRIELQLKIIEDGENS